MGEDWLTQALTSRWTIAVLAYLLGLATGWLLWRAGKSGGLVGRADGEGDLKIDRDEESLSETRADVGDKTAASAAAKLGALEEEIRQAKSILEADAEEQVAMSDILVGLDEAVKRANGRLKLVLKSVKNGGE